jgi:hypothetical protein
MATWSLWIQYHTKQIASVLIIIESSIGQHWFKSPWPKAGDVAFLHCTFLAIQILSQHNLWWELKLESMLAPLSFPLDISKSSLWLSAGMGTQVPLRQKSPQNMICLLGPPHECLSNRPLFGFQKRGFTCFPPTLWLLFLILLSWLLHMPLISVFKSSSLSMQTQSYDFKYDLCVDDFQIYIWVESSDLNLRLTFLLLQTSSHGVSLAPQT